MAALLPLLAMGIPSVLSGISGIMGIANEARKLKGGRIKHRKLHKKHHKKRGGKVRRHRKHRGGTHLAIVRHTGRGPVADALGQIPLLGMLAGPLAKAFGGRVVHRKHHTVHGRGFSNMYFKRHVGYGMLTPPGGHMVPYYKSMGGLLSPAGGRIAHTKHHKRHYYKLRKHKKGGAIKHHRRGHYRNVNGKRIHVKAATVHVGKGAVKHRSMHVKHGGYIPYQWLLRH